MIEPSPLARRREAIERQTKALRDIHAARVALASAERDHAIATLDYERACVESLIAMESERPRPAMSAREEACLHAKREGFRAYHAGRARDQNPHDQSVDGLRWDWDAGYSDGAMGRMQP